MNKFYREAATHTTAALGSMGAFKGHLYFVGVRVPNADSLHTFHAQPAPCSGPTAPYQHTAAQQAWLRLSDRGNGHACWLLT